MTPAVPAERVRAANGAPIRPGRDLVLYWMIASRRVRFNPALERAVEIARELGKPLVVLEALRCDHPYASDRFHAFVLEGMAENARRLAGRALYHPYVEPARGAGKGLLAALAGRACAVVNGMYTLLSSLPNAPPPFATSTPMMRKGWPSMRMVSPTMPS